MRQRALAVLGLVASGLLALPGRPVEATSMLPQTVVDLIHHSETILVGDVTDLTDGIDAAGVPYTEITLEVADQVKGSVAGGVYTFRQFGLLAPKEMPDGLTNLNVSPDGWPRFRKGEHVVLFLYKKAEWTGLQTTVGLFQGKFTMEDGRLVNGDQNRTLFHGIRVDQELLNPEQKKLVGTTSGPVDAEAFMSFVKRAVRERWIEQGRIADAQN